MGFQVKNLAFVSSGIKENSLFLVRSIDGINMLLAGLSGFMLARLFWSLLVPEAILSPEHLLQAGKENYAEEDQKFSSGPANPFLEKQTKTVIKEKIIPVTRLQLILHGVRTSSDGGSAIISESKKPQHLYSPGDKIEGTSAELLKVAPDHVIISRSGKQEKLVIKGVNTPASETTPAPTPSHNARQQQISRQKPPPQTPAITRVSRPDFIRSLLGLSGRQQNNSKKNNPAAAKYLLSKLGLRQGDVILSVDGIPMEENNASPEQLIALTQSPSLAIKVLRQGRKQDFLIRFSEE